MEGKNTGAVVFTIFFILFCAVIGSCFMAFIYPTKKITIEDPKINKIEGITLTNNDGEEIDSLKLSSSKLGLKPATGEEDKDYEIPTTVTDKVGSEGLYSTFYLTSSINWKLYVTNVKIESPQDATIEREHIKVGLKDVKNSSQTLKEDKTLIASGEPTGEPQEYTFYVWLHGAAGESLIGAQISFELTFEAA